jgi:RNA polymerase sigma-70 factor (ECF subfamily)
MTEEKKEIDKELINKVKKGDLKAFDAIVIFYQKAIYSHLYRLVNNPDDALDLVQDTFIKVYKNRKSIDLDKNFKSWLYKIATNTAYDWLRKQKRLPQNQEIDEVIEFETTDANLAYYNMEQANNLDLTAALQSLKSSSENILRLYYQQGFTYLEISEILQMPIGTVKTNIARAKIELAKKFNKN